MSVVEIKEIKTDQLKLYKEFFVVGLIKDEENFRLSPDDDLYTLFPTKDTSDSFTLGAYLNHELAGVVSFERDGSDREKLRHKGTLFRMYVSENFRGKGIAKQLIDELLRKVRTETDIEQINLTVINHNFYAKKLYEKFGFKTFSIEKNAIKWKNKYFTEEQMVMIVARY
jgi:ribosomal protein S18 acetylase RimI-like enzyme